MPPPSIDRDTKGTKEKRHRSNHQRTITEQLASNRGHLTPLKRRTVQGNAGPRNDSRVAVQDTISLLDSPRVPTVEIDLDPVSSLLDRGCAMQSLQLKLRDLFLVTAFFAVLAWCLSVVGPFNGLMWVSIAVAVVFCAVFVRFTHRDRSSGTIVAFVICQVLVAIFSPILLLLVPFFLGLVLVLLGLPVALIRPSLRRSIVVAMSCSSLVFGALSFVGMRSVRQMQTWRDEYPIVPLAPRLTYEEDRYDAREVADLSLSVKSRLIESEKQFNHGYGSRSWALEKLHSDYYEAFAATQGFGVSRMPRVSESRLQIAAIRDVPFDENSSDDEIDWQWRSAFRRSSGPNEYEDYHWVGTDDFLHPSGFGYIESEKLVAGFIPHAFHRSPHNDNERITLDRLELVSLLKFDEPRVYVSEVLPRMDRLSSENVPTRSLDEFEYEALARLWFEKDVVVEQNGDQIRMLGALRADNLCMDCHNVDRGALLGAFTYRLSSSGPAVVALRDNIESRLSKYVSESGE